jgi:hypothetical protein
MSDGHKLLTFFPGERRKTLEQTYSFVGKEAALRFVERNRLNNVLHGSLHALRQAFGDVPLRLEVLEDGEGSTALICSILWAGDMQEARAALKKFDHQWWFSRAKTTSSKLTFDFELI